MDGATLDAWLYFPDIKKRFDKIDLFFLLTIFGGVDYYHRHFVYMFH
jgi:hypothetical protein